MGNEIVLYHDFTELQELVDYYLSHEGERVKVIKAGYNRVCEEYTYPAAVKKIIDTVF